MRLEHVEELLLVFIVVFEILVFYQLHLFARLTTGSAEIILVDLRLTLTLSTFSWGLLLRNLAVSPLWLFVALFALFKHLLLLEHLYQVVHVQIRVQVALIVCGHDGLSILGP